MLAALLLNPPAPPGGTGGWPTEQDRLRYRESTYDEDDPRRKQKRRLVTIIDNQGQLRGPGSVPSGVGGEIPSGELDEREFIGSDASLSTGNGQPSQAKIIAKRLGITHQIPWSEIDDEDDLLALLIIMDEI